MTPPTAVAARPTCPSCAKGTLTRIGAIEQRRGAAKLVVADALHAPTVMVPVWRCPACAGQFEDRDLARAVRER